MTASTVAVSRCEESSLASLTRDSKAAVVSSWADRKSSKRATPVRNSPRSKFPDPPGLEMTTLP